MAECRYYLKKTIFFAPLFNLLIDLSIKSNQIKSNQ